MRKPVDLLACSEQPHVAFSPPTSLPAEVLRMGRLVDYTKLEPGDLILSRDEQADWVSRGITKAQETMHLGMEVDAAHATFTHAMLYIGAGWVLEATFEFKKPDVELATSLRTAALMVGVEVGSGGKKSTQSGKTGASQRLHGVFLTHLGYYGGHHSLRARRPLALEGKPRQQQAMVANALSLYSLDYDFALIRKFGLAAIFPEGTFPGNWMVGAGGAAVVCSTFYARAYDMTIMDEGLTGDDGACTPSFLSYCEGFKDLALRWGRVGSG